MMLSQRLRLMQQPSRCFSSSLVNSRKADVVVLGGGMVGSSLACAIAGSPYLAGRKICLLEGAPKKPYNKTDVYSNRVSATNPNSSNFLKKIGAWQVMEKIRVTPIKSLYVWEDCSKAYIEFKEDDLIGHIVENDVAIHGLTVRMEELMANNKDFDVVYGARVKDIIQENGCPPKLTLENGEILEAELLVGADGANSLVRRKLMPEVSYHMRDYEQMGVVGTVTFATPFPSGENSTAYQKFLTTGPIALLPLDDKRSSLVWTLPPKTAKELVKFDSKNFARILNANLRDRTHTGVINTAVGQVQKFFSNDGQGGNPNIPEIVSIENVAAFPLGLGLPARYVAPRVALVGDACHRVHPLAGLGVNLGYGDAECLVSKLEENILEGDVFGSYKFLCDYETARSRQNLPTALTIDGIQRLYSTSLDPVILARSLGVQILQGLPILKKAIVSSASY